MKDILRDIEFLMTTTFKFWFVIAVIPFLIVCFIVAFLNGSVPYWVWSAVAIVLSYPIGKYAQNAYDKRKSI